MCAVGFALHCTGALGTVAKCSIARYSTATCRPFGSNYTVYSTSSALQQPQQQQYKLTATAAATAGVRNFSTTSSSSTKQLLHTVPSARKSAQLNVAAAYEQNTAATAADVQNSKSNNSGSGHSEPAAVGTDSSTKNGLVGAKNILQNVLPTPGLSGDALFGPRPDIW
jgi:hypothetical protein